MTRTLVILVADCATTVWKPCLIRIHCINRAKMGKVGECLFNFSCWCCCLCLVGLSAQCAGLLAYACEFVSIVYVSSMLVSWRFDTGSSHIMLIS